MIAGAPTSAELKGGVEGVTGPFYQPQTVTGEYARTVGQFPPAVAARGRNRSPRHHASIVPALASETAGQVYKGTDSSLTRELLVALEARLLVLP